MSRNATSLVLAALTVVPVLLPGRSWAASPEAADPAPALSRPVPTQPPISGYTTKAVRMAYFVLHDACSAWPEQAPLASDPPTPLPGIADQPDMSFCDLALDPGGFARLSIRKEVALGLEVVIVVGLTLYAATYAATFLLSEMVKTVGRCMKVLWSRRRANGWMD